MKKGLLLSTTFLVLIGLSGCGKGIGNNAEVNASLKGAPSWVTDLSDDLKATGSAKIINNNLNFARTKASTAARVELANKISVKMESTYRELQTQSGDEVSSEVVNAIRASTDKTLAGTNITKQWVSEDGTLWVLVEISKLNTKLLEQNLSQSKAIDKEAAKQLAATVDELIDGKKN